MKNNIYLQKKWKCDPSKGEVFTPIELVNEMLDEIPLEVWQNPISTFLDPCVGKGTFIIEIVRRLVDIYGYSLENAMSRVYGSDVRVKYINYLKRGGFKNVFHKDFLEEEIKMKFDVAIGNSPYQKNDGGGTGSSAVPIYNKFVEKCLEISDNVLLITPSRWFKGGRGLDTFRSEMLNRTDIKLIKHYQNEKTWFDIELPGGVSYLYIDKNYNGLTKFIDYESNTEIDIQLNTHDILISDVISNRIIDKVLEKGLDNFGNLVLSQNPFGIRAKFNEWEEVGVECYTKDGVKMVNSNDINDKYNIINKYKVITSVADGAAYKSKRYTTKCEIIKPNVISTETYLVCYTSNSRIECVNVEKYLMTKLSRFMLSLRMAAQTKSKDKFKWVPVMDFSREWNDFDLYEYFDLSEEEIEHIEKNVK